jgi:hypothetical protein
MGESGRVLPADLVEFFESGVSILVATRDSGMRPICARAAGASVRAGGAARAITVYLAETVAAETVANLRDNGQIAVTFSRPLTHYSIQVKGTCADVRPSSEEDRNVQLRYRAAYTEQLHAVGLPRTVAARLSWWPSVAIDVAVGDLFVQTPGPTAGRKLEP